MDPPWRGTRLVSWRNGSEGTHSAVFRDAARFLIDPPRGAARFVPGPKWRRGAAPWRRGASEPPARPAASATLRARPNPSSTRLGPTEAAALARGALERRRGSEPSTSPGARAALGARTRRKAAAVARPVYVRTAVRVIAGRAAGSSDATWHAPRDQRRRRRSRMALRSRGRPNARPKAHPEARRARRNALRKEVVRLLRIARPRCFATSSLAARSPNSTHVFDFVSASAHDPAPLALRRAAAPPRRAEIPGRVPSWTPCSSRWAPSAARSVSIAQSGVS